MAIRLEVTGDNPVEFYRSCVQTLQALVAPHTLARPAPPAKDVNPPAGPDAAHPEPTDPTPEQVEAMKAADAPKKRPGRPPKPKPEPVADGPYVDDGLPNPNAQPAPMDDGIPDFLQRATPKPAEPEPPTYTPEDTRKRVQDVLEAARKWYEAKNGTEDAAATMKYSADYTRPLLLKFGVKSSKELKPEQLADFMTVSEAYLKGEA